MKNENDFVRGFDDLEGNSGNSDIRIDYEFELLAINTLIEHEKEFERILQPFKDEQLGVKGNYLNVSLNEHPITTEYYDLYLTDFDERLKQTIDKQLLIESELARFAHYTNNERLFKLLPEDYIANGYLWCMTGRYYTIKDFLHFKVGQTQTLKIEPYTPFTTVEQLKEKWLKVAFDIEGAARGYAIALFVLHLRGANSDKSKDASSDALEEKGRVSTKQAILILEKLGLFDSPTITNKDLTKVAKVIAPIIGRTFKNVYDAIRNRGKLDKDKKDLEVVNELLNHLQPKK